MLLNPRNGHPHKDVSNHVCFVSNKLDLGRNDYPKNVPKIINTSKNYDIN